MNNAVFYSIGRVAVSIGLFFRHWYYNGFFAFFHVARSLLSGIEQHVAFLITLRYFFQPLYQDYSFIGYLFGPVFRLGRLAIGAAIYAIVIPPLFFLLIAWFAAPVFIFYKIVFP